MIQIPRFDPAFDGRLPESIRNKVEQYDLKKALKSWIAPVIELTDEEYLEIKDVVIETNPIIHVKDYYGNPSYYSVMPQVIFDALESANFDGKEEIPVDKEQFDTMLVSHKVKMAGK